MVEESHNEEQNKVELAIAQLAQTDIVIDKIGKRKIDREITVTGIIDIPPQGSISVTISYNYS